MTFTNPPAGRTHIKKYHDGQTQITKINLDHINQLYETCVREIQETDEGNKKFKRMRGSNLAAAAKLAELAEMDKS